MRGQPESRTENLSQARQLLVVCVQLKHTALALLEFFYGSRLGPRTNAFRVGIRERVLQVGDLCAEPRHFKVACRLVFGLSLHLGHYANPK